MNKVKLNFTKLCTEKYVQETCVLLFLSYNSLSLLLSIITIRKFKQRSSIGWILCLLSGVRGFDLEPLEYISDFPEYAMGTKYHLLVWLNHRKETCLSENSPQCSQRHTKPTNPYLTSVTGYNQNSPILRRCPCPWVWWGKRGWWWHRKFNP